MIAGSLAGHLREGVHVSWNRPLVLIEELQPLLAYSHEFLSFVFARLACYSTQGRRIEIVIGKNNVTKTQAMQLVNFIDDFLGKALTGLASIGDPYRAKAAILRTARNGLN